jgi:hypothetical protein
MTDTVAARPSFWQTMRAGRNRILLWACWLGVAAALLALVNLLLVMDSLGAQIGALGLALTIAGLAVSAVVVALSVLGLLRSRRLGARAYAIVLVVLGAIVAVLTLVPILLATWTASRG